MSALLELLIEKGLVSADMVEVVSKVLRQERISPEEALGLYKRADLSLLGLLASHIKERLHGKSVFFIQNTHLEPTNICICHCKFCSYAKKPHQEGAWALTPEQITEKLRNIDKEIREIHITGGTHPSATLDDYISLVKTVRKHLPDIHIKAFSAAELHYVIKKSGKEIKEALQQLLDCGLNSIPGGGAEIFDEKIRNEICADKCTSDEWLHIHSAAHEMGMYTNATMLYGHIESYAHRVDHMLRLRNLQDVSGRFQAFIPLKFKNKNNFMEGLSEVPLVADLRNYAVARIFLDNIPHLKAYWPMLGKEASQLALSFGVDDIDGTINNSTSIYATAGAADMNPQMDVDEMKKLIEAAGFEPRERDSAYNT